MRSTRPSRSDSTAPSRAVRLPSTPEPDQEGIRHRSIFSGNGFRVGEFRCEAHSRAWQEENRIGPLAVLAFATVPVTIQQAHLPSRTADRTRVMLYNPGQIYQRSLVHPDGDRCLVISLGEDMAALFAAELAGQTARGPSADAPFESDYAAVPDRSWLTLRALSASESASRPGLEEGWREERLIELLITIGRANTNEHPPTTQRAATRRAHRELAEAARADLARTFGSNDSLATLARRLHTSPFHLARVFREHTGRSLLEHRRTVRARVSLEMLLDSDLPIASIASRVGYACHAQYSAAFRQVFGCTPSGLRAGDPG